MKLSDYIDTHFSGVKGDFAAAQGVAPAQVTQWLNDDNLRVEGHMLKRDKDVRLLVNPKKEKEL